MRQKIAGLITYAVEGTVNVDLKLVEAISQEIKSGYSEFTPEAQAEINRLIAKAIVALESEVAALQPNALYYLAETLAIVRKELQRLADKDNYIGKRETINAQIAALHARINVRVPYYLSGIIAPRPQETESGNVEA